MSPNNVIGAYESRCVYRQGAQEREPQSLQGRDQRRSPETADISDSELDR